MTLKDLPFNPEQLIELYKGFLVGIDISEYAKSELSAAEMRDIRYKLTKKQTHPNPYERR